MITLCKDCRFYVSAEEGQRQGTCRLKAPLSICTPVPQQTRIEGVKQMVLHYQVFSYWPAVRTGDGCAEGLPASEA